jgi:hypothetical protein
MGNADEGAVFDIITRFGKITWREDARAVEEALSEALKRSLQGAGREDDYEEAKRWLLTYWRLSLAAGLQDAVTTAVEEAATLAHVHITSDKHDRWNLVKGSATATTASLIPRLCDIGRVEPVGRGEHHAKEADGESKSLTEALAEMTKREKEFEKVRGAIETCLGRNPERKPTMSAVAELLGIGSKRSAGGHNTGSSTLSNRLHRLAVKYEKDCKSGKDWKSGKEVFDVLVAEVRRRIEQKDAPKSNDFGGENTSK